MYRINVKIALRNLWKNRNITSINVGGLAVALAAFLILMMYYTYETSYDKKNPNYSSIYLIGRHTSDYKTNFTPPNLKKILKEEVPEIVKAGVMKPGYFEFSVTKDQQTVFIKNLLSVDVDAANMFHLNPVDGWQEPQGGDFLFFINKSHMQTLSPDKNDRKPFLVNLGSKAAGQTGTVSGVIEPDPHSNISFDAISLTNELGSGQGFGFNNYYTYIQVKPGTSIPELTSKIETIYKREQQKIDKRNPEQLAELKLFLDPLKDLHLRSQAGGDTNYKVLLVLSVLGVLLLVIACINFTNLTIVQAARRAKEVGVKKVLGAYRLELISQFLLEIFFQCLLATVFALVLVELLLPQFNQLFQVQLSVGYLKGSLAWQLPLVMISIVLISGIYPAFLLSGFKPSLVLKGNYQHAKESHWLRNSLLIIQLTIAISFITGLLMIKGQLHYMQNQDIGFRPQQVVHIRNIATFNHPDSFKAVREKMMEVEGLRSVTVSTTVPDGSKTGVNTYTMNGKQENIHFVDVDFDYFETLNIQLKEGRFFQKEQPADTVNALIMNESAVAKYGLTSAVGKIIRGCNMDYQVVGVVKDFKSAGFEKEVEPTVYSLKNPCGNPKLEILAKIDQKYMSSALASLKANWISINKLDGEHFRYEFLDVNYARLFKKQEQLHTLFLAASMLTIGIALLGLFAFSKYITYTRTKEIAIRKVLGANELDLFKLLNNAFIRKVLIANILSIPFIYVLTKQWLSGFAYHMEISYVPFFLSAGLSVLITFLTVSYQAWKAIHEPPALVLKGE